VSTEASWAVGSCTIDKADGASLELVRLSVSAETIYLTPTSARQLVSLLLLAAEHAEAAGGAS
jgi:hypothetical protein